MEIWSVMKQKLVTLTEKKKKETVLLNDFQNLADLNFSHFEFSLLWQYWSKF